MFFGRKEELKRLNSFYNNTNQKIACIYGREGMGKTSLVKEFSQDKKTIYFNAYATTGRRETELLARACSTGKTKLNSSQTPYEQIQIILEDLKDRSELEDLPIVFILDNYHIFARADLSFNKAIYDFTVSADNIKFIFLGDSYLGISKLFFEKKSIWNDSLDLSMEVLPLGFYDTAKMLSNIEDPSLKAAIFGMTGGIPKLLARIENAVDIESAIRDIIMNNFSGVLTPERTMQTELRELSYYNHILTTLAEGISRVNQISHSVDKPKDVVVPYMNTLMSIGMVTKENPITEKTNRKKTRYSIINSFDLFWYKFFAFHMEKVETNDMEGLMESSINIGFHDFMNTVFVSICKEYLLQVAEKGKVPFTVREVGNWWQNDDEKMTTQGFDIVALGETDEGEETIIFGCCYYTDEPVEITILKELIDLTKQVKGKKNVFYMVFSKSGFHENTTTVAAAIKNIILVSLEDIMNG